MDNKEDIILRIKEIIFKKGMTITQFAIGANIDQSNLSSILNNKRSIGTGVLSKIALAYDINIEWLTTGEGSLYSRLSEPSTHYGKDEYKEKYIKSLEDEVIQLRKTVDEQSQIIQGFMDGTISKLPS